MQHAILAVLSGDGLFRWIGAAGEADPNGSPLRRDTPFHIASIDKLYTAAVIMQLYEHRRVDLDTSIANYLPQSLICGLHRVGGVDYTNRITVRNLLGHTSGLADCYEDRPRGGRSLMERLFQAGDMEWNIEYLMRRVRVRDELSPHFPPQAGDAAQQRVRYSDTNYQLLIAIIEAVAEKPIHQVYEEMLFRPLKLRHTWLFGLSAPHDATAAPATIWFADRPLHLPLALRSFPSVYSTVDDQLKFLLALIRGELFNDTATLALMRERWNRFGLPRDAATLRAPSWPIEYGLGIMRFQLPRLFTGMRLMPAVIGHTGSTGAWLFYCEELDLLLAGTVNQATAGAIPYRVVLKLLRDVRALRMK
ncbi:MAG: beta-lactamase family protein [Syntrophomonadaceae bacterium]|nr:beta-lactamase family protein [Syntrophomonadaceae bacterium]